MQTIIKKYLDIKDRFKGELLSGTGFSSYVLLFSVISADKADIENHQLVAKFLYKRVRVNNRLNIRSIQI